MNANEIYWWLQNINSSFRPIAVSAPTCTIQTDASLAGWGEVYNSISSGHWSLDESDLHINVPVLELKAIYFSLSLFCRCL